MAEGTILVRRRALGDVVLVGAVAAALGGEVTVVTDPRFVALVGAFQGVTRAIAWPRRAPIERVITELPRHPVVDLEGRAEVARLARALGVPYRRWSKGSVQRLRWLARLGPGRGSVIARYAEACGVRPDGPPWIDPPARADASGIALVPGAAWATKRWPVERFIALGQRLPRGVVLLGSAEERSLIQQIAAHLPGSVPVVERGFDATLDALRSCRLAVGGDTGLLHLAGALGVSTVTLFGPTHPADGFAEREGRVAMLPLPCRPCALHGRGTCPLRHHRCMRDLTVEAVYREVMGALAERRHSDKWRPKQ